MGGSIPTNDDAAKQKDKQLVLGCCDTVMLSLNFSLKARVYSAFAFAYATAYVCLADVFLWDAFPPLPFVHPISFLISFRLYSAPDIAFPLLPTLSCTVLPVDCP